MCVLGVQKQFNSLAENLSNERKYLTKSEYGRALEKRHGDLRLRKFVVVSLGFERIWWAEVG
jgi:hypothetical protein